MLVYNVFDSFWVQLHRNDVYDYGSCFPQFYIAKITIVVVGNLKRRWDEFIRLVSKNQILKTQDPAIFPFVEFDLHRCKGSQCKRYMPIILGFMLFITFVSRLF